ncbi:MAG TPA: helix-turn-helix transcriptional regulator, partial [Candidatus Omnitrophota bacterium]|nr:helix-turn-helix transcriptional regulator [Candidatus Omnitrophota bacterium]
DPAQKRAGESLRALRRSKKMTQSELAAKTGLTQQYIAKIEKGLTNPRSGTLEKIRKALGAKPYEYAEGPLAQSWRSAAGFISEPGTTLIED